MYSIACQFGVGYKTLLTQLLWGERMLSRSRADVLRNQSPQSIRAHVLGRLTPQPLIMIDGHQQHQ